MQGSGSRGSDVVTGAFVLRELQEVVLELELHTGTPIAYSVDDARDIFVRSPVIYVVLGLVE